MVRSAPAACSCASASPAAQRTLSPPNARPRARDCASDRPIGATVAWVLLGVDYSALRYSLSGHSRQDRALWRGRSLVRFRSVSAAAPRGIAPTVIGRAATNASEQPAPPWREYLLSRGTDGTLATCLQQLDEHGDRAGVGHVDALLLANRKVAQRARDMRSILGLQRRDGSLAWRGRWRWHRELGHTAHSCSDWINFEIMRTCDGQTKPARTRARAHAHSMLSDNDIPREPGVPNRMQVVVKRAQA